MDAYLAFRIAAYLFLVEGVIALLQALVSQLHGGGLSVLERAGLGGNNFVGAVVGIFGIATGVGLMLGKRAWRWLAMFSAATGAGWGLAVLIFSYWPLGAQAWDGGTFIQLISLALLSFQTYAVATPTAIGYCNE